MDIEILKIAADTKNNKDIKNFTHRSKYKNTLCGDEMEFSVVVKNQKILDIGYQCKSCIYCQASASLLSKLSINKSLKKIKGPILVHVFTKKGSSSSKAENDSIKYYSLSGTANTAIKNDALFSILCGLI